MVVDPNVRRSILRILSADRDARIRSTAIAEELGLDVDFVEASLEVMHEEGLVEVTKPLGGGWGAIITSRGYLEARGPDHGVPEEEGGAEKPVPLLLEPGEARDRLQEQLQAVEKLLTRRRPLTLGDIEEWKNWTETVVRRTYGESSRQLADFEAVMGGHWPGPAPPNVAGYTPRLARWRALLKTWVRELDEFGSGAPAAVRYIPAGSQLDAYVQLKDTVEQAVASLAVVDPYVDDSTLKPLLAVKPGVKIRVLTVKPSKDFAHAVERFRQQSGGNIEARQGTKELHDRFLLVDDRVFFSGASLKHLGQKGSVIAEIRSEGVKNAIKKDIENWWKQAQPIT